MNRKKLKSLIWVVAIIVVVSMLLLERRDALKGPVDLVIVQPTVDLPAVLMGVEKLELIAATISRSQDLGKGKLGSLRITAPQDGNLRLEEITLEIQGLSPGDVEEIWLRLNSVRIYAVTDFPDTGMVRIRDFPPIYPKGSLLPAALGGFNSVETLEAQGERQLVIRQEADLPQIIPGGQEVNVGLYAKWKEGIAPRSRSKGVRMCVRQVRGSLIRIIGEDTFSEEEVETRFAAPLCWPTFGIAK